MSVYDTIVDHSFLFSSSRELEKNYNNIDYATAIIPKITGTMSFTSSIFVLQDILRDPRKRKSTYHLILCGLSCCDISSSFVFMMGTWIMQKNSQLYARGSFDTCAVFGFINQFANLGSVLYVATLSMYYLLILKFKWPEAKVKNVQLYLVGAPGLISMSFAIAGAALHIYGSANWLCWISPAYREYWLYFMYIPVWSSFVFITVTMVMIYRGVREIETKSSRYTFSVSGQRNNKKKRAKSKRVMRQAFFYVGALLITWLWGSILRMHDLITHEVINPVLILMTIFFPLQGFFNLLVYFKPKILCYAPKGKKTTDDVHQSHRLSIWRKMTSVFRKTNASTNASVNAAFPIPITVDTADPNVSFQPDDDVEKKTIKHFSSSVDEDNEDDDYLGFNDSTPYAWRSEPCISDSCNDDSMNGPGNASQVLRSSLP